MNFEAGINLDQIGTDFTMVVEPNAFDLIRDKGQVDVTPLGLLTLGIRTEDVGFPDGEIIGFQLPDQFVDAGFHFIWESNHA
jgi:hypothetical protein